MTQLEYSRHSIGRVTIEQVQHHTQLPMFFRYGMFETWADYYMTHLYREFDYHLAYNYIHTPGDITSLYNNNHAVVRFSGPTRGPTIIKGLDEEDLKKERERKHSDIFKFKKDMSKLESLLKEATAKKTQNTDTTDIKRKHQLYMDFYNQLIQTILNNVEGKTWLKIVEYGRNDLHLLKLIKT